MIYWLLKANPPWLGQWHVASSGDSEVFLMTRTALATMTAFVLAVLLGPYAIAWLKAHFRERIDSASARLNELHAAKNATPTMGGIFIVGAIALSVLLFGDLSSPYVQQALVVTIGYGILGGTDDWIKIRTSRRGLTARQKMLGQVALGVPVLVWLWLIPTDDPFAGSLVLPFGNLAVPLGLGFLLWGLCVLVGSSNGVNLTDGLDGLASGCLIFSGAAFTALSYFAGHRTLATYLSVPHLAGAGELCIPFGALVGATLGFLWFNCYPAQVFMGDAGSLPTGALLGYGALAIHQELLLVIVGGIFVVETLSVLGQVSWFKLTGRRLIACSPLHNHFLFRGEHEMKIVVRFWIGSALLAVLAIASLKIR